MTNRLKVLILKLKILEYKRRSRKHWRMFKNLCRKSGKPGEFFEQVPYKNVEELDKENYNEFMAIEKLWSDDAELITEINEEAEKLLNVEDYIDIGYGLINLQGTELRFGGHKEQKEKAFVKNIEDLAKTGKLNIEDKKP